MDYIFGKVLDSKNSESSYRGITFESCLLDETNIEEMKDCVYKLGNSRYLEAENAIFENVTFYSGFIDNSNLKFSTFKNCNFKEIDFAGNDMNGTTFINCTFEDVDFSRNNFKGIEFKECAFSNVTGGYNTNADKAILNKPNFMNKRIKHDIRYDLEDCQIL